MNRTCEQCFRSMWVHAVRGEVLRYYCPQCEKKLNINKLDPLPKKPGVKRKVVEIVWEKTDLPTDAYTGTIKVVKADGIAYVYTGTRWIEAASAAHTAELIEEPERKLDRTNNRRAAIEATRKKIAERAEGHDG